jgi:hypothetical protein
VWGVRSDLFFEPHFRTGEIMNPFGDVLIYHHTGQDIWLGELLLKHCLLFALQVRMKEVEVDTRRSNVTRAERL